MSTFVRHLKPIAKIVTIIHSVTFHYGYYRVDGGDFLQAPHSNHRPISHCFSSAPTCQGETDRWN